jgi:hypothetical protein
MKFSKPICLLAITLLSSASYNGFAQEKDKDRNRAEQVEREHRVNQQMDRSRDSSRDREIDRDRFNDMGDDFYGSEFMTTYEGERYKERLQAASSERERSEIREQHQKEMKSRNRNREQYEDDMGEIIYGGGQMTEQERNRYREELEAATSIEQRNNIKMKHQEQIHLREQADQN